MSTSSPLNPAQQEAAHYQGAAPLLVIAGAGSGKTNTLAHRVAHLIGAGTDPRRILLLTFTRRAAAEMSRRAERLVARERASGNVRWSGTFHAVANRLLRLHCKAVGLDPAFTVLDRADAADLLNLIRNDSGLAKKSRRFPKKGTCLSIYSRVVNAQEPLATALKRSFPWCEEWEADLRKLFGSYVEAKQRHHTLDYDDLLLYWYYLMQEPAHAEQVAARFDQVLVDEYQDTNALQASILTALRPTGEGLTVVGDDAQAIYSFRAASVQNILDYPKQFSTPARVVTLERNYRSTQPILDAANAVIEKSPQRYSKKLRSHKPCGHKPHYVVVDDEELQVEYVVQRVLETREAGLDLRRQAVLFRTSHHSDALEVELGRRNIPFVKYGGLKFLEAAHIKDVLCVLRWAENDRDAVAAFRVLQLLPGVGPAMARRALEHVGAHKPLASFSPPAAAQQAWPEFCAVFDALTTVATEWAGQLHIVRRWYEPLMEELYDSAHVRGADLEQLEQISAGYVSRERFLTELTLDPPDGSGDHAGPPLLDEDYLILSTIHSAKGQEWDSVYLLNAADGCIPSDMATGDNEQIEEERRLLYVAMTRAKKDLHLVHPLRMYIKQQARRGDRHVYTPRTRFLPDDIMDRFDKVSLTRDGVGTDDPATMATATPIDMATKLRQMW